jgi:hypothetical protein
MNLELETDFDDVEGRDAEPATSKFVSIVFAVVVKKGGGTSRQVRLYLRR